MQQFKKVGKQTIIQKREMHNKFKKKERQKSKKKEIDNNGK